MNTDALPTKPSFFQYPIVKAIKIVFNVALAIVILYNFRLLGVKYLVSSYYYFGEPAGIIVLIMLFAMLGGWVFISWLYSKRKGITTPVSADRPSRFGGYITSAILIIFSIISFIQSSSKPEYDAVYAYGSPEALSEIIVSGNRIKTGSDPSYVLYYQNLGQSMSFQKSEWKTGESPIGYSPHQFPQQNVSRIKVISDSSIAPDGATVYTSISGGQCTLKVNNTFLLSYEARTKYSDCKFVGWTKRLY